jgi:dephospho-CoA kinase
VHLFGLTGGIASGKSTVAARFRGRGVPVIDADELAREVVAPGSAGLRSLAETFGAGVLGPDGSLDRKAMGRLAFADESARKRLNAITHPLISRLTTERAAALASRGEPLACYEAALIVENGVADAFRPLVVVGCSEEIQLTRIQARDGTSLAEALSRVRAQKPLADKIAVADFVIDSSGSLQTGALRTDEVLRAVCLRVGVDPARYLP